MSIDVESKFSFEKRSSTYERKHFRTFVDHEQVVIIPRDEWGAKPPSEEIPPMPGGIVNHVLYVYQTNTAPCRTFEECSAQLRMLQNRCMDVKPDIFYNFMVGGDGKVYEGRGWSAVPDKYHRLADHMDPSTMYVGYIGDFADIHPNIKQWHAGWKLLEYGFRKNLISEPAFRMYYCS